MTTTPIRSQARRATTAARYEDCRDTPDTSSPSTHLRRLAAGVLSCAIRSLAKVKRDYEGESPEVIAEWLWQERDCLRAFGITRIPSERTEFMTWIYDVARRAKRNHVYLQSEDMGERVSAGIARAKKGERDNENTK